MSNSYFGHKAKQAPVVEKREEPKQEFKQYEEEGVKHETVKGLTSIIIPAWFNSYSIFHYTGHCIGSIREHTDKEKTPYEIILVVQGNTGIKIKPEESYADKVIELEENLGFAKAVNKGIRVAFGEYIAIVNNDTMLFNHWLEDFQLSLKAGLDLVQATPQYGEPFARAVEADKKRSEWADKPIEESFDGFKDFACVLTTKALFDKVGLFNEEFEMYCEDLDLIRRIEKAGGKVSSTKRVNIFHIIQGTSSGRTDMADVMNRSKEKLKEIWGY